MSRLHVGGLVALDAGQKLPAGRELPEEINVAPWGVHDTAKGRIVINDTTAQQLPVNQRQTNFDRIALDFNHNTVPGSEAYQGEPAKVAATGAPCIVPGRGIILNALDWTPEGRAAVQDGHYGDLSPTLQLNSKGEAVFIHSAALCRQGAIPGLTLFSASEMMIDADLKLLVKNLGSELESLVDQFDGLNGQIIAALDQGNGEKVWGLLCESLDLDPATATEAQVEAKARELLDNRSDYERGVPLSARLYGRAVDALDRKGGLRPDSLQVLAAVSVVGEKLFLASALRPLGLGPADVERLGIKEPSEKELAIFSALGLSASDTIRAQAHHALAATPLTKEVRTFQAMGLTRSQIARLRS